MVLSFCQLSLDRGVYSNGIFGIPLYPTGQLYALMSIRPSGVDARALHIFASCESPCHMYAPPLHRAPGDTSQNFSELSVFNLAR